MRAMDFIWQNPWGVWLSFVLASLAILFSGIKLSRYGDILAEKTGLGGTWIGIILMASVTSLPEMISGIGAVAFHNLYDIAVGGIVGSCLFNVSIIALIDMISQKPVSSRAHRGHIIAAGFGIFLLSTVGLAISQNNLIPSLGRVGVESIICLVFYFIGMRLVFFFETGKNKPALSTDLATKDPDPETQNQYDDISTKKAVLHYLLHSTVIVIAALILPKAGDAIGKITGLNEGFVGNLFIALATSLPEIVVSLSAARMGAIDMAYGNLFGSNLFNLAILGIEDFFVAGPILGHASKLHLISIFGAMASTAIACIGLTYRALKKPFFLAWDSIGLILIYFGAFLLLYFNS